MWFAIFSEDVEDSLSLRKVHRPAHLARLKELHSEQRVLIAGPHPLLEIGASSGFSGSLVVADFDSLREAQLWADHDPYFLNGIYQKVTIKPFTKVLPD